MRPFEKEDGTWRPFCFCIIASKFTTKMSVYLKD